MHSKTTTRASHHNTSELTLFNAPTEKDRIGMLHVVITNHHPSSERHLDGLHVDNTIEPRGKSYFYIQWDILVLGSPAPVSTYFPN